MDQLPQRIGRYVEHQVRYVLDIVSKIPGSTVVGRYIYKSHQNDPARTIFEILLVIFAIRYFLASKQSYYKKDYVQLTEAEVEELINDWEPKPLINGLSTRDEEITSESPVFISPNLTHVNIKGMEDQELLNLTSSDIHGVRFDPEIKRLAVEKMRYYGVGSCGPAGFYGNEDAHIHCEEDIAKFLGTERCILYSQGISTAPSVIPCFVKRGDVLVVDDAVGMGIQRGLQLSRSKVLYYQHNNMADLEKQLAKAVSLHRGKGRIPRRFIVTEGLFEYTGTSPDLVKIVELKKKYKFRLMLDETWSLGVLGKTGRGLVEETGVDRKEIDATIGSLAGGLGIYGGFCAGSKELVEHQRIISLAYTFSATEPPALAVCTSFIVNKMANGGFKDQISSLREKAKEFTKVLQKSKKLELISREDSPIVHFRLQTPDSLSDAECNELLHQLIMRVREKGILICRLGQVPEWETFGEVLAVKLFLPNELKIKETLRAAEQIAECADIVMADY